MGKRGIGVDGCGYGGRRCRASASWIPASAGMTKVGGRGCGVAKWRSSLADPPSCRAWRPSGKGSASTSAERAAEVARPSKMASTAADPPPLRERRRAASRQGLTRAMQGTTVTIQCNKGVGIISIADGASTVGLAQPLADAVTAIASDSNAHVLLLQMPSGLLAESLAPNPVTMLDGTSTLATLLASISKPTVAAISGDCMNGGLETALACDIRVASLGLPVWAHPHTAQRIAGRRGHAAAYPPGWARPCVTDAAHRGTG